MTPAGFNRSEVGLYGENCELQMPHAKSVACMQSPHTDSCTQPPQVNPHTLPPSETTPISSSIFTEQKQSTLKVQYGTLVRPTVHDPHPDRSRSSLYPNSHRRTESPTPSLYAHAIPSSQRPSSSDGEPRTDLESPILGKCELRPHTNTSTGSNGMEPDDTNTQSTTSPRTTTSNPNPEDDPRPCTGLAFSGASSYTASLAAEHPREFNQCGVTGTSARSHYLLSRLMRNQHCAEGRGTKTVRHVRHALGKVSRARANV